MITKNRLELMGVPVDVFASAQEFKEYVSMLASNGASNQIIFLTYRLLLKARRQPSFLKMLQDAALVLPAEPIIAKSLAFVYKQEITAAIPVDVVIGLLSALESMPNKSVYLVGGSKKHATTTYQNLRGSYPSMLFVGYHEGTMKDEQQQHVLEAIRKASPTVLLTSRGVSKQERWLYMHRNEFKPGITVYCRECFDVFVGKKRRPNQRELENIGGFKLSRLLSYPIYGLTLLNYRLKVKRALADE